MRAIAKTLQQADQTELLILPLFQEQKAPPLLIKQNEQLDKIFNRWQKQQRFTGKQGQMQRLQLSDETLAQEILLLGLGAAEKLDFRFLQRTWQKALKRISQTEYEHVSWFFSQDLLENFLAEELISAAVEAHLLSSYEFLFTQSDPKPKHFSPADLQILTEKKLNLDLDDTIYRAKAIAEATNLVRNLINLPANQLTPNEFANRARDLASETNLSHEILDENELEKLGANAFLSVSQGSSQPGKLIVLKHREHEEKLPTLVLIGKGVTFDTGGTSLKPSPNMHEMKADMGGAATVLGVMRIVTELDLPLRIIGLMPAVENQPDGSATRPGDVVTAINGKTVEILNTDAEGRLILADSLCYAERFEPQAVIDIATLTGATLVALGSQGASLLGNDEALLEELQRASEQTTDRIWPLPLWPEYGKKMIDGVADFTNIPLKSPREAGTITAASFLSNFVPANAAWAHLDIAGVAYNAAANDYAPKGATGFGVKLLTTFLENMVSTSAPTTKKTKKKAKPTIRGQSSEQHVDEEIASPFDPPHVESKKEEKNNTPLKQSLDHVVAIPAQEEIKETLESDPLSEPVESDHPNPKRGNVSASSTSLASFSPTSPDVIRARILQTYGEEDETNKIKQEANRNDQPAENLTLSEKRQPAPNKLHFSQSSLELTEEEVPQQKQSSLQKSLDNITSQSESTSSPPFSSQSVSPLPTDTTDKSESTPPVSPPAPTLKRRLHTSSLVMEEEIPSNESLQEDSTESAPTPHSEDGLPPLPRKRKRKTHYPPA